MRIATSHKKQPSNPHAFVRIPRRIYDLLPKLSQRGPRLELAVLSGFSFHWLNHQNALTLEKTVEIHNGELVEIPFGQFWVSILTIAQDLYHRWFGHADGDLSDPDFSNFYSRCVRAAKELEANKLLKREEMLGFSGIRGSLWSVEWLMEWNAKMRLQGLGPSAGLLTDVGEEPGEEFVNAVDLIGKGVVNEDAVDYNRSEFCVSYYRRGYFYNFMQARNIVARNLDPSSRHLSVGAWESVGKAGPRYDAPVAIPEVILDVDRDDIVEAHEATYRLCEQLELIGLEEILVAYTGGNGFHIHIPCGAFNKRGVVFKNRESARQILTRWADEFLEETVDVNLFDPIHLYRMIGSRHEKTGLYKTPFTVQEFLEIDLETMVVMARTPRIIDLADPRAHPVNSELALSLAEACDRRFYVPPMHEVDQYASGAGLRALEGCSEGEAWHERHEGRSKLLFVAGCYLLRRHDAKTAFEELKAVNKRCTPPMGLNEVKSCFKSAQRTVNNDHANLRRREAAYS